MTLIFAFTSLICIAQGGECNQDKLRRQVLVGNKINKHVVFNCEKNESVELAYLGVVGNKSKGYKIVRSTWIHGESHRATNRILVFDEQDKLLGNYYVTTIEDLPEKIESRELVFLNSTSDDCDKTVISRMSFDDGIPEEIFVRCQNNSGDFFSFSEVE